MGKKRNLNGLPNTLVQRYFSALFYWRTGYMPEWLWFSADEKSVTEIEIDILNQTVKPKELEIKALVALLPELSETINKTLKSNGFPSDFIVEAKISVYISQKHKASKLLSGTGFIKDVDGKVYEGSPITEKAYAKPFDKFPKTIEMLHQNIDIPKNEQKPKWWQIWKKQN